MPLDFYAAETRPRPVLAVQVTADNVQDIARWIGATEVTAYYDLKNNVTSYSLNRERTGIVHVQEGYWVVQDNNPEVFDLYRAVSGEQFAEKYYNTTKAEGVDA